MKRNPMNPRQEKAIQRTEELLSGETYHSDPTRIQSMRHWVHVRGASGNVWASTKEELRARLIGIFSQSFEQLLGAKADIQKAIECRIGEISRAIQDAIGSGELEVSDYEIEPTGPERLELLGFFDPNGTYYTHRPTDCVRLEVSGVLVRDPEEDQEHRISLSFVVPIDLIENFSPKRFKTWVRKTNTEYRTKRLEDLERKIKELQALRDRIVK